MRAIKLGQLCHVKGRIGFRGYKKTDLVKAGEGAIVIGGKNISTNTLNLSNPDYISWKKYYESPEIMVGTGDIIIAQRGTIGKMGFVKNEIGQATINPSLVLLKDITCDNAFLFYYLLSLQDYIISQATQTVIPMITQKQIENLTVQLPDIDVQKAIASTLQSIDDKISTNNKIIETSERLMREIYDYWFMQFDFPDENGRPYKSSGGEMIYDKTLKREIPKGWSTKKIGNICKVSLGGTPSRSINEYWEDGDIDWLSSGEIANFPIVESIEKITHRGLENSAAKLLKAGSIVISITGNIRISVLAINASANQSVVGIEESEFVKNTYLYQYLSSLVPEYESKMTGAVQKHINKDIIAETLLILPHKEVLDSFEHVANPILKSTILLAIENKKLASLRDWLLPMLMNGQIKVSK